MVKKEKNRVYTLEYIEKIFRVIPITFILILSMVLIFIVFIILESKQKRDIDLLQQKELLHNQFNKKEKLTNFSNTVKNSVKEELSSINKILQEHTYKVIGSLDSSFSNLQDNSAIKFLEKYEYENNIKIVLFKKTNLEIIYGDDRIDYLSKLIFGKVDRVSRDLVLQYIYSQGRYNLQEWKNDLTGVLKLSFFDVLKHNDEIYYVGTFSKDENIRLIIKSKIIEQINKLKKTNNYNIWFFDLLSKITYNFKNKNLYENVNNLFSNKTDNNNYKILEHFNVSEETNKKFVNRTLFNSKYNFAISISYDENFNLDTKIIKDEYHSLFMSITIYIVLFSFVLIIASLIFSKFTKGILDKYNKELQERTDSLTHWKNRFELAIIASNDGLWDIDFDSDKIYFSDKWLEISGYKKDEIISFSDWFDLIHKDDKNNVEQLFEQIFTDKRNDFMCEYRLKTKNAGFKWILARGRLFKDKDTGHKRMLMMSMDIDKNKRLKKELLDVELLVEDGKIVLFKVFNDENLSIKYISNAIKNYGYTKELFENKKMNFLDLICKEDINIVKVAMNEALSKDLNDFTFVCRALNAANEIRWISCRTLVLKDHSGNVVNFYGYINDITKIKLSEQDLKVKVKDELSKNREKDRILIQQSKLAAMGEMLGNIAHQWRQPLNSVFLFLQFLKDNYKNEKANELMVNKYFDKSFTQIQYMSQTIDDFRNFYKPSKQKEYFSIKSAIDSTLEIIKAQLKVEDVELILEIKDKELLGFENELKQSLLNIFNNAQDAIKQKRDKEKFDAFIKVKTKISNDHLEIFIKNNGVQINDETISRVFEPYFTTKFESQGTGIGLYMTKSIIETNMHGSIKVKNIEKDGVSFKIKLPLNMEKM